MNTHKSKKSQAKGSVKEAVSQGRMNSRPYEQPELNNHRAGHLALLTKVLNLPFRLG